MAGYGVLAFLSGSFSALAVEVGGYNYTAYSILCGVVAVFNGSIVFNEVFDDARR